MVTYEVGTPNEVGHVEAYRTLAEAKRVARSIAAGCGKTVSVYRHDRLQYSDHYQIVYTAGHER